MSKLLMLLVAVGTIAATDAAKARNCEDVSGSLKGILEISGAPGFYAKLEFKCGGVVLNSCKAIVGPKSNMENGDAKCTFPATKLTKGELECLTTEASSAGPGSKTLGSCDVP